MRIVMSLMGNVGLEDQDFETALKEKEDELARLLYVISHDFRSPLATVKGYAGILRESVSSGSRENIEPALEAIEHSTQRLGQFLDAALVISRLYTRKTDKTKFSFADIANDALAMNAQTIAASQPKVIVENGEILIFAERVAVRTALSSLIENALAYACPRPQMPLVLSCRTGGGAARLSVADAGPGVEEKDKQRIFLLFERACTKVSGTGAGLAVVHRVAELHKGDCGVISRPPAQGAEVWFTLDQP